MNIHFRTFLISLAVSATFFGCYALGAGDLDRDRDQEENYYTENAVIDLPCDQKLIPSDDLVMVTRPFEQNELATHYRVGSVEIRESLCGIKMAENQEVR